MKNNTLPDGRDPGRQCCIIGGADIADYAGIRALLPPDCFFIYCDGGLRHLAALGTPCHLVVGDFDSHTPPDFDVPVITLPHEKDDTDVGYAVKEAVRRGCTDFTLAGVIGNRFDHSLGNISLLLRLYDAALSARLLDDYSDLAVIGRETAEVPPDYPYFSLINLFGDGGRVTVEDAKFPLKSALIPPDDTLGISNEPLPHKTARITVESGRLLLIRVRKA